MSIFLNLASGSYSVLVYRRANEVILLLSGYTQHRRRYKRAQNQDRWIYLEKDLLYFAVCWCSTFI